MLYREIGRSIDVYSTIQVIMCLEDPGEGFSSPYYPRYQELKGPRRQGTETGTYYGASRYIIVSIVMVMVAVTVVGLNVGWG